MRAIFSNANQMKLFLMIFPHISLHCKLVTVQNTNTVYLTIIPRTRVGYELAITISYPTSASRIIVLSKTLKRVAIFELPNCFRWRESATSFVVSGIWAHILLPVNQSKRRNFNFTIVVFNNGRYPFLRWIDHKPSKIKMHPLQLTITWYKITPCRRASNELDIQNKEKSGMTAWSLWMSQRVFSCVLARCYFVLCDRSPQRVKGSYRCFK